MVSTGGGPEQLIILALHWLPELADSFVDPKRNLPPWALLRDFECRLSKLNILYLNVCR